MVRKLSPRPRDRSDLIRLLFENSGDMMLLVDPDRRVALVNPAWERIVGWREDEVVGRSALDFWHRDDLPGIRARLAAGEPGKIMESQARLKLKGGGYLWIAARRQMTTDNHHILCLRDATDERARVQELTDARRTRKMLGASAGIGIWSYDPVQDRITWSDELAAMLGIDPAKVTSPGDHAEMIHGRYRQRSRAIFDRCVRTGAPAQIEHKIRAHGGWKTVRVTIRTEPAANGLFIMHGISEDITELAAARDAARRGEQQMRKARREAHDLATRLNLALKAAEAGVYEIDHVRQTFWVSPEFSRVTGLAGASYEEATELRFPGFHPEDLEHVRTSLREMRRKDTADVFEARIIRPDGETRWVRVSHDREINREGRWVRAIGLMQDIDERKRQELALVEAQQAAQAAAEAKAAFLANMSHEIRTPMNGVMGVLHLLK